MKYSGAIPLSPSKWIDWLWEERRKEGVLNERIGLSYCIGSSKFSGDVGIKSLYVEEQLAAAYL
jgi:hypothetical protein